MPSPFSLVLACRARGFEGDAPLEQPGLDLQMATSLSASGGPALTTLKNRVFLVRHGQVFLLRTVISVHVGVKCMEQY